MSHSPPHARTQTTDSPALLEAALVGAGGAIGAVFRAGVAALFASAGGTGMAATQVVNLVGAFALGVLVAGLEMHGPKPLWRAFLAVGGLGAFTTFSSLVGESRASSATASWSAIALFWMATSLVLGILCFQLGQRAGSRVFTSPRSVRSSEREPAQKRRDIP